MYTAKYTCKWVHTIRNDAIPKYLSNARVIRDKRNVSCKI